MSAQPRKRNGGASGGRLSFVQKFGDTRVCSRPDCRRTYRLPTCHTGGGGGDMTSGLCSRCRKLIEAKAGARLNAKLYAECQKAAAEERRLWANPYGRRARAATIARRERALLTRYDRRPMPMVPTRGERLLGNGYTPTANSGKRGGPSGRGE